MRRCARLCNRLVASLIPPASEGRLAGPIDLSGRDARRLRPPTQRTGRSIEKVDPH